MPSNSADRSGRRHARNVDAPAGYHGLDDAARAGVSRGVVLRPACSSAARPLRPRPRSTRLPAPPAPGPRCSRSRISARAGRPARPGRPGSISPARAGRRAAPASSRRAPRAHRAFAGGQLGPFLSQTTSVYESPQEASAYWKRAVQPGLITCVTQTVQAIARSGVKVKITKQGSLAIPKTAASLVAALPRRRQPHRKEGRRASALLRRPAPRATGRR